MKKIVFLVLCCTFSMYSQCSEEKASLYRDMLLSTVEDDYDFIYDGYVSDSTFIAFKNSAYWLVNLYSFDEIYLCEESDAEMIAEITKKVLARKND